MCQSVPQRCVVACNYCSYMPRWLSWKAVSLYELVTESLNELDFGLTSVYPGHSDISTRSIDISVKIRSYCFLGCRWFSGVRLPGCVCIVTSVCILNISLLRRWACSVSVVMQAGPNLVSYPLSLCNWRLSHIAINFIGKQNSIMCMKY